MALQLNGPMPLNGLRLIYVVEYLVAIVAILNLWAEVGGASHMDLISWYTKLSLILGLATSIVIATQSAVAGDRAWNARTITWSLVSLAFVCAMGTASYYAHLHENDDSQSGETASPIALVVGAMGA
jgi:hypothetical protein